MAYAELKSKNEDRARKLHWRGALFITAAAVGVFFLLFLLDVAPTVT